MEALLDVVKDYNYKGPSQSKYGGLQHKLIFIVPKDDGTREQWSCQVSPKMKNYIHWVDLIQKHKANPGHHIEVYDLVPWTRKPYCFDADEPPRMGAIHKKPSKKKKTAPATNEFKTLFE